MKFIITNFLFFVLAISHICFAQDSTLYRPAHIGFIYPLSTNGMEAAHCNNGFSFHALAGVSRSERSFVLSGLASVVKQDAKGLMLSGLYNKVGYSAKGVQLAGMINVIGDSSKGLQLAGLLNKTKMFTGFQLAGLANVAYSVEGLQAAGLTNIANNSSAQLAGFANLNKGKTKLQAAGFINIADTANVQVAGFINVAKKVKGVQLAGFINIAEESDYPVGVINIVRNGERQIGVSVDENGSVIASFVSGGRVSYGTIGIGYNFMNENARYVLEGGGGIHLPLFKNFRVNGEMTASVLTDITANYYFKSTAKILAAFKFANKVELYAGPTFNQIGFERSQTEARSGSYLWTQGGANFFSGYYIGATGGIRINL